VLLWIWLPGRSCGSAAPSSPGGQLLLSGPSFRRYPPRIVTTL